MGRRWSIDTVETGKRDCPSCCFTMYTMQTPALGILKLNCFEIITDKEKKKIVKNFL